MSPLSLLDKGAQSTAAPLLAAIHALIADQALSYIGNFQNDRTSLPITLTVGGQPGDFVLEMDRTSFQNDVIHYEVEIELHGVDGQAATEAVHAFFKGADVGWHRGLSKAKRFFNVVAGRPIE